MPPIVHEYEIRVMNFCMSVANLLNYGTIVIVLKNTAGNFVLRNRQKTLKLSGRHEDPAENLKQGVCL